MEKKQKITLAVLAALGVVYFILFLSPNNSTMGSDNPLVYLHKDEYVTYPIVERMLLLEGDIHMLWGRWIIYGDYHYGYPFYFLSALVLLPLRLLRGSAFFTDIPLNILILRQVISGLPMILAAGFLAWVQTHFKSVLKASLVFVLILTIPAVVRANLHWWHPDALMLLAIALTFYFLDQDDFRLGRHFYLAAAACGMVSAIKLIGVFFFLAIAVYLLVAWRRRRYPTRKVLAAAGIFILVMLLAVLFSNPFLFYKVPRDEMLAIQRFKTEELRAGYSHEESLYYSLGPKYWRWTLSVSYGKRWFIYLLMASLGAACAFGDRRELNWLILAWCIPIGIYLLWFVSPKPDHYLLPLMLPLYSGAAGIANWMEAKLKSPQRWVRLLMAAGLVLFAAALVHQFSFHFSQGAALFARYFS